MPNIEVTTKIERTPAEVRAVVLDFENMHQWHSSFLKVLKPLPEGKSPVDMQPGDDMYLKFLQVGVNVKCVQNDARGLEWAGGPALLFLGSHYIRFEETDGGRATIVHHGENFSGLIGQGTALPIINGQTKKLYEGYSADLKKRCESS